MTCNIPAAAHFQQRYRGGFVLGRWVFINPAKLLELPCYVERIQACFQVLGSQLLIAGMLVYKWDVQVTAIENMHS